MADTAQTDDQKRWIVLRWKPTGTLERVLVQVSKYNEHDGTWPAATPGDAFRLAVLENISERVESTSYMVLPFAGGATFSVSVNLEAEEHAQAYTNG